ncbi:hypothetical protein GIB67_027354 [Kingdonia uniflora]|uniref:Uncharacterized protein n=1 Tax=Kingdonia uniflora TaxID=39325 RepID=A0A7J7MF61_9MAGN|nr:hypothetical protein GIB67_027354 [Kingdonia uniflora]
MREQRDVFFYEVKVFGGVWVTVVNILGAVGMTEDVWFGRYIHGFYVVCGRVEFDWFKEALLFLHDILVEKQIEPNQATLSNILTACAQLEALDQGRWNNTATDAPPMVDSSSVTVTSQDMRKASHKDVTLVHNLIEHSIQLYMTRDEVVKTLLNRARTEPSFTTLEWDSSKWDPSNVCVGIESIAADITPIIHTSSAMLNVATSPASVASSRQFSFTPSDILGIGIDTSTLDTTFMSDVASPIGLHLELGNEHGNDGNSLESFCDIPWNLSLSELTDGSLILGGNLASIFNVKVVLEALVLDVVFLVLTS